MHYFIFAWIETYNKYRKKCEIYKVALITCCWWNFLNEFYEFEIMCIATSWLKNVCLYIDISFQKSNFGKTQVGEKWGWNCIGIISMILSQYPIQNTHYFFHIHQQPIEVKLWTQHWWFLMHFMSSESKF